MDEIPSERELRRTRSRYRWLAEAHESALRFHLSLHLAFAGAALALLKIEGPYFSDAIAAGLFACGFFASLHSMRSLRASAAAVRAAAPAEEPVKVSTGALFFVCVAIFHLAAAVTTIYLTYVVAPEVQGYPEAAAQILYRSY